MKIIQCENYHYYDGDRYEACPYCKEEKGMCQTDLPDEEEKTVSQPEEEPEMVTVSFSEETNGEFDKTIGLYRKPGEVDKVTGWLVCVKGEKRGASWQIGYGRNSMGRALDMDICFSEDLQVSRKNHCFIVYDERSEEFYAVPGNGTVKLQGQILREAKVIREDMILEIGEGAYQFVPYCNGRRTWIEKDE